MAAIHGALRADRRTKNLLKRLRHGDIAVISHPDLDAMAAQALVEARVAAVVNAGQSITGRYPNVGPSVVVDAGIPLIDAVGDRFFEQALALEGHPATIDENVISCGSSQATGTRLSPDDVRERMDDARRNISAELDAFARNTLEYLANEKALLLDPVDVPNVATAMRDRHVLIVVRGEGYRDDLRSIEPYLRDVRPVLLGVDGGADALIEVGVKPDIILGDMDSVSDEALRCGAELVVHGYVHGDREAPGLERIRGLGLAASVFHVPGTSEDAAMLLADEKGASLIVAVGTHFSLVDFLDKGRHGMASTFLVRLRIGSKLVDAKGIGRLWPHRTRLSVSEIMLLVFAVMLPLGVILWRSPLAQALASATRLWLRAVFGLH